MGGVQNVGGLFAEEILHGLRVTPSCVVELVFEGNKFGVVMLVGLKKGMVGRW